MILGGVNLPVNPWLPPSYFTHLGACLGLRLEDSSGTETSRGEESLSEVQ